MNATLHDTLVLWRRRLSTATRARTVAQSRRATSRACLPGSFRHCGPIRCYACEHGLLTVHCVELGRVNPGPATTRGADRVATSARHGARLISLGIEPLSMTPAEFGK